MRDYQDIPSLSSYRQSVLYCHASVGLLTLFLRLGKFLPEHHLASCNTVAGSIYKNTNEKKKK